MLRKVLLKFILLLSFSHSFCQQIILTDLLKRNFKEVKIYSLDSFNVRQLKIILNTDLANYTIKRINIERNNGLVDTAVEIIKFNSDFEIVSIESKSKCSYSNYIYSHPTNDTSITNCSSKNDIFRIDSAGNIVKMNSNEYTSNWKTTYNKTRMKITEYDERGVTMELKRNVNGKKTTTTKKYYRRNSSLKKSKSIYVVNITTSSQVTYFFYRKGESNCKKFITNRTIEYNEDGTIKKEFVNNDYCALSTEYYEFEYIK